MDEVGSATHDTQRLPAQLEQPLQLEQLLVRPDWPAGHVTQLAQLPASVAPKHRRAVGRVIVPVSPVCLLDSPPLGVGRRSSIVPLAGMSVNSTTTRRAAALRAALARPMGGLNCAMQQRRLNKGLLGCRLTLRTLGSVWKPLGLCTERFLPLRVLCT